MLTDWYTSLGEITVFFSLLLQIKAVDPDKIDPSRYKDVFEVSEPTNVEGENIYGHQRGNSK